MERKFWVFVGIILVILLILFGARIYLHIKFLIGNDVLINLNANQKNFNINHGDEQTLKLSMSVMANLFCTVECDSKFIDLSKNEVIDSETFELKPLTYLDKEYALKASPGRGQELYRFDVACKSPRTFLCDTGNVSTRRSIFVTVNYDFNDEEKQLQKDSQEQIISFVDKLNHINEEVTAINSSIHLFKYNSLDAELNKGLKYFSDEIGFYSRFIDEIELLWKEDDYQEITLKISESSAENFVENFDNFSNSLNNKAKREVLEKEIYSNLFYDILCKVYNDCKNHPSINELASTTNLNISLSCNNIEKIKSYILNLNFSLKKQFELANYSKSASFWRDINVINKNYGEGIVLNYLQNLQKDEINSEIIETILKNYSIENADNPSYPEKDLKPALIADLAGNLIECNTSNTAYSNILDLAEKKITNNEISFSKIEVTLPEPIKTCCVSGKCQECCEDETCLNNPTLYPVLFLHGHDFNRDLSVGYSYNLFDDYQQKLSEEGFLDAGTISLDTLPDVEHGIWGMTNAPLTFRGSYYSDIIENTNLYRAVQTKNEDIDNYAIRLKDLIDGLQYRTARPKITIIAHSMGGLVARRYMQLFGSDDVDKLIMIGTPNYGIKGDILRYCPIFGAKMECIDMNFDSLFISKINNGNFPDIPIYNIVGTGCVMNKDAENGDGVVVKENCEIINKKNVKNYYFEGKCEGLAFFHTEMLSPYSYPEIYGKVKNILKGDESV